MWCKSWLIFRWVLLELKKNGLRKFHGIPRSIWVWSVCVCVYVNEQWSCTKCLIGEICFGGLAVGRLCSRLQVLNYATYTDLEDWHCSSGDVSVGTCGFGRCAPKGHRPVPWASRDRWNRTTHGRAIYSEAAENVPSLLALFRQNFKKKVSPSK